MSNEAPSILKAAWLIALVTVVSKFIGFARDMVVANYYGATMVSDAYFYALQIPSLAIIILGGVGGPFHSATVAVFSKLLGNDYAVNEKINKLYNSFLTITFTIFFILSLIGYFFADKIMQLVISAGTPELINLATEHFRIMSPIILIGGIIGIVYGLLICHKKYLLPNFSPMILSVVVILTLIFSGNDSNGKTLAIATTVGAFCQLLIQVPKLREIGYRIKPNFDIINNKNFKSILELLFPAILSSTIGQISVYVDMFFASALREGAWTSVILANRIFQFPIGILVTAFLVPLFPIFSRLAFEKKLDDIKTYFNKGVGTLFFVTIPLIIIILSVSQDAISLIFERGAFNSQAVLMVSEALCFLSLSMLPYVFRDSITRIYYAFDDSKTPFYVATSSILLKVALNYLLILKFNMGIAGITLATSLITLINATLLGIFVSKKIQLNYKELFINLFKMLFAGIITFISVYLIIQVFDANSLPKYVFETVKILIVALSTFIIYAMINVFLKMDYAKDLFNRILKR